jgi:DNA repair exonuclease SbcCD nuclease subunit
MYVLFGDKVMDSKEMKELIEASSDFKVVKDMSKGSKREDVLAFNLSIGIDTLNEIMEEDQEISEEDKAELSEDDLFDEYLTLAEEVATELEEVVPEGAIFDMRAYKWDKSDNDIKLVVAIAHEELGDSKLGNVMKILLKQIE